MSDLRPIQGESPGCHDWGKGPGPLGNSQFLIPKPRPWEQTPGPGLVLSKAPTQKSWLLETHMRPGLGHKMGPRTIPQKQIWESWCILQPCITEQGFLPFTRVHVVPLPKLPFLLLSLWRTPMHPSRSSSNVPSSEAFPDPVMFPHPISGLLASCILTTSLLASMLLFLLPQMWFLSKTHHMCLFLGEIATVSPLPKTVVLKLKQASASCRRLLKTQIAGPHAEFLIQQVWAGAWYFAWGLIFCISNKVPGAAAGPRAVLWEQIEKIKCKLFTLALKALYNTTCPRLSPGVARTLAHPSCKHAIPSPQLHTTARLSFLPETLSLLIHPVLGPPLDFIMSKTKVPQMIRHLSRFTK